LIKVNGSELTVENCMFDSM